MMVLVVYMVLFPHRHSANHSWRCVVPILACLLCPKIFQYNFTVHGIIKYSYTENNCQGLDALRHHLQHHTTTSECSIIAIFIRRAARTTVYLVIWIYVTGYQCPCTHNQHKNKTLATKYSRAIHTHADAETYRGNSSKLADVHTVAFLNLALHAARLDQYLAKIFRWCVCK